MKIIIADKSMSLKGVVGLFTANKSEDGEDDHIILMKRDGLRTLQFPYSVCYVNKLKRIVGGFKRISLHPRDTKTTLVCLMSRVLGVMFLSINVRQIMMTADVY